MSLIACPECQAQISVSAAACPQCGAPGRRVPANTWRWQQGASVALCIIGIIMLTSGTFGGGILLISGFLWFVVTRIFGK